METGSGALEAGGREGRGAPSLRHRKSIRPSGGEGNHAREKGRGRRRTLAHPPCPATVARERRNQETGRGGNRRCCRQHWRFAMMRPASGGGLFRKKKAEKRRVPDAEGHAHPAAFHEKGIRFPPAARQRAAIPCRTGRARLFAAGKRACLSGKIKQWLRLTAKKRSGRYGAGAAEENMVAPPVLRQTEPARSRVLMRR